jgi:hypothetical protein
MNINEEIDKIREHFKPFCHKKGKPSEYETLLFELSGHAESARDEGDEKEAQYNIELYWMLVDVKKNMSV